MRASPSPVRRGARTYRVDAGSNCWQTQTAFRSPLADHGQWVKREAGKTPQVKSGAAPATVGELCQVSVPLRFGVGRRLGRGSPTHEPVYRPATWWHVLRRAASVRNDPGYSRNQFGTPLPPLNCLEVSVNARRVQVDL